MVHREASPNPSLAIWMILHSVKVVPMTPTPHHYHLLRELNLAGEEANMISDKLQNPSFVPRGETETAREQCLCLLVQQPKPPV
jgi:hypothetical protein